MLRKETVEANTLELLIRLQSESYLSNFFLVGGTALSLQIGHRKSIDLDFFTIVDFESSFLINQLLEKYNLIVRNQTAQSLVGVIDGIKVDFIRFHYPFSRPVVEIEGVRMLSVEDIAPMKLDAGRGKKKDFYDLYFLLQKFNLREILNLYSEKFKHQTNFHVIKSLSYFEDAEPEPDPIVFEKDLSWEKVKKTILSALENLK